MGCPREIISEKQPLGKIFNKNDATVKISTIYIQKLFEISEEMSRKMKQGLKLYLIILTGVVVGKSFQIKICLGLTTFFIHNVNGVY